MKQSKGNPPNLKLGQEFINKSIEMTNIVSYFNGIFRYSFLSINKRLRKIERIYSTGISTNQEIIFDYVNKIKDDTYRIIETIQDSKVKLMQISHTKINYNIDKNIRFTHKEMYKMFHNKVKTILDIIKIEIASKLLDLYILKSLHSSKNGYLTWYSKFKKEIDEKISILNMLEKDNDIIKEHLHSNVQDYKSTIRLNLISYSIKKFLHTSDTKTEEKVCYKQDSNVITLTDKKDIHKINKQCLDIDYHRITPKNNNRINKSFNFSNYTISIVDRDMIFAETIKTELNKACFKTLVFNNTNEAVENINQNNTSLILLDANMTTFMGEDFLKMVYNKYGKNPHEIYRMIPVILTSPFIDKTILNKIFYHRFRDFIIKPFSINDLIKKIVQYILR